MVRGEDGRRTPAVGVAHHLRRGRATAVRYSGVAISLAIAYPGPKGCGAGRIARRRSITATRSSCSVTRGTDRRRTPLATSPTGDRRVDAADRSTMSSDGSPGPTMASFVRRSTRGSILAPLHLIAFAPHVVLRERRRACPRRQTRRPSSPRRHPQARGTPHRSAIPSLPTPTSAVSTMPAPHGGDGRVRSSVACARRLRTDQGVRGLARRPLRVSLRCPADGVAGSRVGRRASWWQPRRRRSGPIGDMACRIARHRGIDVVIGIERVPERLARGRERWIDVVDLDALGVDKGRHRRSRARSHRGSRCRRCDRRRRHGGPRVPAGQARPQSGRADARPRRREADDPCRHRSPRRPQTAIEVVRRGGIIVVIGVYGGMTDPLPMLTLFDKLHLRMGQANVRRRPAATRRRRRPARLGRVTHRLPLDQAPAATPCSRTSTTVRSSCRSCLEASSKSAAGVPARHIARRAVDDPRGRGCFGLDELHIGYKDLATHQSSLEDIFVSLVHEERAA